MWITITNIDPESGVKQVIPINMNAILTFVDIPERSMTSNISEGNTLLYPAGGIINTLVACETVKEIREEMEKARD